MPFSDHSQRKIAIALTIYLTALLASNTLGLKVMPFLWDSPLSVSVFFFPFVFLATDVVGEVYGKSVARSFVLAGILANLLFLLFSLLSMVMPWSSNGEWVRESYGTVFGVSARIAVASLVAFAIAEYQDVWSFFAVRERTGSRLFWLRSLLSNLWSQFFDTVVFMLIAFYGVYEPGVLAQKIIAWWLYKVAMGTLYTPLSYLGIKLLRWGEPRSTATA